MESKQPIFSFKELNDEQEITIKLDENDEMNKELFGSIDSGKGAIVEVFAHVNRYMKNMLDSVATDYDRDKLVKFNIIFDDKKGFEFLKCESDNYYRKGLLYPIVETKINSMVNIGKLPVFIKIEEADEDPFTDDIIKVIKECFPSTIVTP